MEGVAVHLQHEPLGAPQEVDLVSADADIRLRRLEPCGAHEPEQALFRLGARQRGFAVSVNEGSKYPGALTAGGPGEQRPQLLWADEPPG